MTTIPPVQQPVKSGTSTTQNQSPQQQAAQAQARQQTAPQSPTQSQQKSGQQATSSNPSAQSSATQQQTTQNVPAQNQQTQTTQAQQQSVQQSNSQAVQNHPQTSKTQNQQHQIQVKTPPSIPTNISKELAAGQNIRVEVQAPPQQAANKLTLQTSSGPITVTVQSGTQILPPPNTQANLHVSFHAALTGKTGQGEGPLLLNLSWTGGAVKATLVATPSSSVNVTLNSLQGIQLPAVTLSENSIAHLLPKAPTNVSPSPAVHPSSIRANPAALNSAVNNGGQGQPNVTLPTVSGTPIAPNQTLNVQVASLQLPNQTLPAGFTIPTSGPTGLPAIQATVVASQAGNTILQTSVGPMSLPISNPLPPGSLLTLLPLGEPTALSQSNPQLGNVNGGTVQERWAMLQHAMSMLQAGNTQAAQQIMQAMPQANTQMATSMLFLLSTLRGGALENWVGRTTASRISGPMGERLIDSIKQNTRQVRDGLGQEWRAYGMPVPNDNSFGELWLYLKDKSDDETNDSDQKEDAKRFIIETSFEKMGPLQLDGFATQEKVDLMFRSIIPVEEKLRDEIRALFNNTITALGLTGTIRFHVSDHFPVSIAEEDVTLGSNLTI